MIDFETARAINALVNNSTQYKCDSALYSKPEFWEVANGAGDCEDFALAKRKLLIEAGCPRSDLSLATCYTEQGDYHAVLIVRTNQGQCVLDNRFPRPQFKDSLGYRWHKVEVGGEWHELS